MWCACKAKTQLGHNLHQRLPSIFFDAPFFERHSVWLHCQCFRHRQSVADTSIMSTQVVASSPSVVETSAVEVPLNVQEECLPAPVEQSICFATTARVILTYTGLSRCTCLVYDGHNRRGSAVYVIVTSSSPSGWPCVSQDQQTLS